MGLTIEEIENINPVAELDYQGTKLLFSSPNRMTLWRAQSLTTKEPDTLEWINGFSRDDVMLDIGANVGMYTIVAAKVYGVKVFAFEPESSNFALLNKNIFINNLQGVAKAFPVAVAEKSGFGDLNLSQFKPGGSCHNFGEAIDFKHEPFNASYVQGAYSTTIDDLINMQAIPMPQHIKIDVDGIEEKVIAGGKETLKRPELKSVLIEINTNLIPHREIVQYMLGEGFSYSDEQVNKYLRKEGAFEGVGNYIFYR